MEPTTDVIDIILLASGFSKRFGRENKLLHVFRGKTFLEHAVDLACAIPQAREVIMIYGTPETGKAAAGRPIRKIHNQQPERGVCESVRLGVDASDADYYLFLHGDQPFLDLATIETVLARRRPGIIVEPSHAGKPGTPSLFSSFFREDLLTLSNGESPNSIKRRHAKRVHIVDISSPWPLRDIDTQQDLFFLKNAPQ